MPDIVIDRVRPWGGAETRLLVRDGRFFEGDAADGAEVIDGAGMLALPGLVDAHCHIDKTLIGTGWHSHRGGPTVADRIRNEREVLAAMDLSPAVQSARLVDWMAARGTTHCRTHVDIGPDIGLANFNGVAETRDRVVDRMDMQIVAFPQTGVMLQPGTLELLDQACSEGAEIVGGLDPIGIDRDPVGQLDGLFAIAERRGVEIDIHLHDPGEVGAITVDMVHERTKALGLKGGVALSHAFCLGSVPEARLDDLIAKLIDQDIAIMTHGPSGNTPFPPVRRLHDAGVRLFTGSDGVRDAWGPMNSGDMLERTFIVAYRNGFRHDADLELCLRMATEMSAAIVGADAYGLQSGCRADLVLVDCETVAEAVAAHPRRSLVMKAGRVIARDGALLLPPSG
ncbi:MAG: amidohydrolase family protein [Alphaproteobacteria bacterium]